MTSSSKWFLIYVLSLHTVHGVVEIKTTSNKTKVMFSLVLYTVFEQKQLENQKPSVSGVCRIYCKTIFLMQARECSLHVSHNRILKLLNIFNVINYRQLAKLISYLEQQKKAS